MTDSRRAWAQVLGIAGVVLLLVGLINLLTNSIDTGRFSWDFRYYIDIAEHGFAAPMASPFAYRYVTPMLARGISLLLHLPTEGGFAVLAQLGAVTQLLAVFVLTRRFAGSARGAWVATLTTAFSLFNVKFLLFDTFRPDHLAFPLILLQAYFALTGRFAPLLMSTIIGCQIREFNAIPLLAYVYASIRSLGIAPTIEARRRVAVETVLSAIGLGAALVLPRLLIPVNVDFQFATLTREGVLRALLAPLVLARDFNFAYSIAAYALPVLMLCGPRELFGAIARLSPRDRLFLGAYTLLVLVFSFLGGTDFFRFSAYLLLPQAILLGLLANKHTDLHLAVMLACVFVFNRIWLAFPISDLDSYLDFYGGYGARFTWASALRAAECAAFFVIGLQSRRLLARADVALL
jgi:hypothetical protein